MKLISFCLLAALSLVPGLGRADVASPVSPSPSAPRGGLFPLRTEGKLLVANGRPLRLRGIDLGWWHLWGTIYSEADLHHLAGWGANVARLAFSYNDLETDDNPPRWKEDGFAQMDEVVQWGKRYGIYIILDMHVVPGGQTHIKYCAHGQNRLWTDPASQEHFIALWREIARRFHDRPEIAAYELLNEPTSGQPTPTRLRDIDERAIAAIRSVDPAKIIVVGGDNWSNPDCLVDAIKLPDPNILYTFHWYEATEDREIQIPVDRPTFLGKMAPALEFANKYNVPVWVGEFGVQANDRAYQSKWVNLSIACFEKQKFSWSYWNFKETTTPDGMGLEPQLKNGTDYPVNESLLAALRAGWALNALPPK